MGLFGVKVNRAHFAFFICATMTIANIIFLIPALQQQKISTEACNELINNFTSTHTCVDTAISGISNWSVYHGGPAQ